MMNRKSDQHTWTAGQMIEFLKDFPEDAKIFFYIHDDVWDGISSVSPAMYDGGDVRQFDEDDEAERAREEGEEVRKPNAIIILGNHN